MHVLLYVWRFALARTCDADATLISRIEAKAKELTVLVSSFIFSERSMSLVVNEALQTRIYAQMEAAYPNEGGGFLLGSKHGDQVRVEDVIQVQNIFSEEEQYHRYAMRAWEDFGRYEDEADSRGLRLLGYYHSHPDWPAVPSDFDRDHAFPNFIFLITSVEKGKAVVMRAWQLRADYSQFDELGVGN